MKIINNISYKLSRESLDKCKNLDLDVVGTMCLPPFDSDPKKYFQILKKISEKLNLTDLSIGMSADYEEAIYNGSTFLRLGTIIFGERHT